MANHCPECGRVLDDTTGWVSHCGRRVESEPAATTQIMTCMKAGRDRLPATGESK